MREKPDPRGKIESVVQGAQDNHERSHEQKTKAALTQPSAPDCGYQQSCEHRYSTDNRNIAMMRLSTTRPVDKTHNFRKRPERQQHGAGNQERCD